MRPSLDLRLLEFRRGDLARRELRLWPVVTARCRESASSARAHWHASCAWLGLSPCLAAIRMPKDRAVQRDASDETLMERYVNGDAEAFDELFQRYEPRAFSYFIKRTRSPERAQDLYQDLFLRIHRGRDAYDRARPFAPWFFQIAHRLLIDDGRRGYRKQEVSLEEEALPPGITPDVVAAREELAQLLDTLSADERYVLVAAKGEGVGYAELAARLGKSVDAVKKMASRATLRLRATSLASGEGGAALIR